jgi:hypothetical protein
MAERLRLELLKLAQRNCVDVGSLGIMGQLRELVGVRCDCGWLVASRLKELDTTYERSLSSRSSRKYR